MRQQLDALFTTPEDALAHAHRPYRLTTLKRSLELMRPAAIRDNVQDYAVLQALFTQVYPVVQALDLSEEVVRYYARYVDTYFNLDHRHSALDYQSPHQFEQDQKNQFPLAHCPF